ncbi:hypothetical protein CWI37_0222p0030 [Hamiltosporidium tvaerminnensis]|uniref:Uncharacterized protein n=2 Tax=Hamiltosporidium TaxID=1176354 RepID=A0A4Q9L8X9_9MICR|nr:hypothetical protein CWI37_0222p0030 [Hamiltosporidium tvaerminnensis]
MNMFQKNKKLVLLLSALAFHLGIVIGICIFSLHCANKSLKVFVDNLEKARKTAYYQKIYKELVESNSCCFDYNVKNDKTFYESGIYIPDNDLKRRLNGIIEKNTSANTNISEFTNISAFAERFHVDIGKLKNGIDNYAIISDLKNFKQKICYVDIKNEIKVLYSLLYVKKDDQLEHKITNHIEFKIEKSLSIYKIPDILTFLFYSYCASIVESPRTPLPTPKSLPAVSDPLLIQSAPRERFISQEPHLSTSRTNSRLSNEVNFDSVPQCLNSLSPLSENDPEQIPQENPLSHEASKFLSLTNTHLPKLLEERQTYQEFQPRSHTHLSTAGQQNTSEQGSTNQATNDTTDLLLSEASKHSSLKNIEPELSINSGEQPTQNETESMIPELNSIESASRSNTSKNFSPLSQKSTPSIQKKEPEMQHLGENAPSNTSPLYSHSISESLPTISKQEELETKEHLEQEKTPIQKETSQPVSKSDESESKSNISEEYSRVKPEEIPSIPQTQPEREFMSKTEFPHTSQFSHHTQVSPPILSKQEELETKEHLEQEKTPIQKETSQPVSKSDDKTESPHTSQFSHHTQVYPPILSKQEELETKELLEQGRTQNEDDLIILKDEEQESKPEPTTYHTKQESSLTEEPTAINTLQSLSNISDLENVTSPSQNIVGIVTSL